MSKFDKRIKQDTKSGLYYFVISAGRYETGDKKGKRRQLKRKGFKTKREAHEALVELEYSIKNGTFFNDSDVEPEEEKETAVNDLTVSQCLNDWLNNKMREINDDSLRVYKQGIRRIEEVLGHLHLNHVTKSHVKTFLEDLIEEGLSGTYIDMVFRPLKNIFTEYHEDGLISVNPTKRLKLPSKKRISPSEIWNEEESNRFLREMKERFIKGDCRHYIAYSIALQTGMRLGEILALTWENVNLKENFIMVMQTVTNEGKIAKRTKSKSSKRMIMIPDSLVEDLRLQKEFQLSEMTHLGYKTNLVLSTKKGTPFIPTNVGFHYFARDINIVPNLKKIRFHDLRHTHATILLEKGIPAKAVQERLGHSSISITLDIYSHVTTQLQREVISKLDSIFSLVG